jgi:hypothetical protein
MALSITWAPAPSEAMNSRASSSVTACEMPRATGTRFSTASRRAAPLSPSRSSTSGRGPTKHRPASAQRRAKAAFSLRNP